MFRCDTDRIEWYLDRDLAVVVTEEPMTIQLTFTPKGKGHIDEPFYLSEKENCCVVCGGREYLTRHHAVPHCYRRFFPEHLKSRSSHDVLPVCVDCHETYEKEAQKLKKQIAAELELPINGGTKWDDSARQYHRAKSSAHALVRYLDKIPSERQEYLRNNISEYLGKVVTDEDIEKLAEVPRRGAGRYLGDPGLFSHGRAVVEKITDFDAFVVRWRKHFCDTMNPQHLHEHWDVNHRVQTRWEGNQNGEGIKVRVMNWIARFVGLNPSPK